MGLRELARAVSKEIGGRGVTHAYLSAIESGRKPAPRMPILEGLASALSVSPLEMRMAAQGWTKIHAADLLKQQPHASELLAQVEMGTASNREIVAALLDSYDETPLPLDTPKYLILMPEKIFMAFLPFIKHKITKIIKPPQRRRISST